MLKRFKRRTRNTGIEFCERCSTGCDSSCRSSALRDRALDRVLLRGAR